jgi:hypothetical protein
MLRMPHQTLGHDQGDSKPVLSISEMQCHFQCELWKFGTAGVSASNSCSRSLSSDLDAVDIFSNDGASSETFLSANLWSDLSGAVTDPEGVDEDENFFLDSLDAILPPTENSKHDCDSDLSELSGTDISWTQEVIRSDLNHPGNSRNQFPEQICNAMPNCSGLVRETNSIYIDFPETGKESLSSNNFGCSTLHKPPDLQAVYKCTNLQPPDASEMGTRHVKNGALETSHTCTDYVRSNDLHDSMKTASEHLGHRVPQAKIRSMSRTPKSGFAVLKDYFLKNLEYPYPTHAQKRDWARQHGITLRMINK